MGEYLSFKKLITPVLIQVLFWVSVVSNTFNALFYSGGFFRGLMLLIIGPIVIRIVCEALIVVFEINNTLTEIRDNQVFDGGMPAVPSSPAPFSTGPLSSGPLPTSTSEIEGI